MAMLLLFLLLPMLTLSSSADLLQNPDFETPPTGLPENSSTTGDFTLLLPNATISGWTFEGTVYYINGSRRGIQLGPDGKINQTFTTAGAYMNYLLTVAAAGASLGGIAGNCTETVGMVVSAPDSRSEVALGKRSVEEAWPNYGVYLGTWSAGESVNVVVESESVDVDVNSTCWPIVDFLLLKKIENLVAAKDNNNKILNGGFESGPEFIPGSTEGILLDSATSPVQSPLSQWSIIGPVKYIDSNHFLVPNGTASVQLISTNVSSIQTPITLVEGTHYTLEFLLGYPNASCVGDLGVRVEAGPTLQTFSVQNNGTGSADRFSLALEGNSSIRTIGFVSSMTAQTKDGVVCGPVIDDVVLRASGGARVGVILWKQMVVGIFFVMSMITY